MLIIGILSSVYPAVIYDPPQGEVRAIVATGFTAFLKLHNITWLFILCCALVICGVVIMLLNTRKKVHKRVYENTGRGGCMASASGTVFVWSKTSVYLLRVTPFQKSGKRVEMFHMQQKASELGIPMCRPVEIGACEDGVYILQTWIDGEDAEEVLPKRSDAEQYEYGLEAGRILCRLHTLPGLPA